MRKELSKIVLGLLLGCTVFGSVRAQISFGGNPPSFSHSGSKSETEVRQVMSGLDTDKLQEEENQALTIGLPPRLGVTVPVDFNLENSGRWEVLSDGTLIWRLSLRMPGALATIVSYEDFYIPEGYSLYLYTPDRKRVLGAFRLQTHPQGGSFSTGLLPGESVVLELSAPGGYSEKDIPGILSEVRLRLSGLAFCYNRKALANMPGMKLPDSKYGESEWCTININCEEGADWQVTKKSVCKMFMYVNGGWYLCTGTLMNNTAQNIRPYVLSAYHCLSEGDPDRIDFNQWQFIFDYESPVCEDAEPLDAKVMVGCRYRAGIPIKGGSDGLLLELQSSIPEDWGVYYSGWDRRAAVPSDSVAVNIHHPAGDIKKISVLEGLSIGTWPQEDNEGDTNAHIMARYTSTFNGRSITEGGSSGSGLFNSDKRFIGTLTGGNASCDYPDGNGYYGRLWYHWDRYGTDSTTRVSYWLDPLGTGAEILDGIYIDPNAPRIDPSRSELEVFRTDDYMQPSRADTFSIRVANLYEPVHIWTEAPFQVSGSGADFALESQREGGGPVYVRYDPRGIRRDTAFVFLCSSGSDTACVRVVGNSCLPLSLEPEELEYAYVDRPYEIVFAASGSDADYTYEIVEGRLPEGLSLSPDGLLSGTPLEFGLFAFSIRVSEPYLCDQIFERSLYVACDIVKQFPFEEGFETGEIPSCWTQEFENGQTGWQFRSGVDNPEAPVTEAYEGDYNALFRAESYEGYRTKLVTPQLDLSGLDNPCLGFAYAQPVWITDQDLLSVHVKSSATDPWKELVSFQGDIPQWKDTVLALPDPSSEYFVAFEGLSKFGYGVVIDDIRVGEGSAGNLQSPASFQESASIRCNNPVRDRLALSWTGTRIAVFRLYGMSGVLLGEYPVGNARGSMEIPMGNLPAGVYMLQAEGDSDQYVKIIKR